MSLFAVFEPKDTASPPRAMEGLVIREAREDDLGQVAGIAAAREGTRADEAQPHFEQLLGDAVWRGTAQLLVADVAGEVIGFGKSGYHAPERHAPSNAAPPGWYLTGVVVDPRFRRRGAGDALTRARMDWIAARSPAVYYFANARNAVTIELHRRLGFVELTRSFHFPGVRFEGGEGILFRADLAARNLAS